MSPHVVHVRDGEICLATFQPRGNRRTSFATGLLVDVGGNQGRAHRLIEAVRFRTSNRGARRSSRRVRGAELAIYTFPAGPGQMPRRTIHFVHRGWLVATDNLQVATDILERVSGESNARCLSAVPAFQLVLERASEQADAAPAPSELVHRTVGLSRN